MNTRKVFLLYGIVSTLVIGLAIMWIIAQTGQTDEFVVVPKELLWGGGIALLDLLLTTVLFILVLMVQPRASRANWWVFFCLLIILPASVVMSLVLARHYAISVQKP